mmetsp:Transcript_106130/g.179243  ORF Transcript_106130/g.179243 Transcript_106130/m.179243 type:complete len:82 (-) Transcript_106130:52-297(-)
MPWGWPMCRDIRQYNAPAQNVVCTGTRRLWLPPTRQVPPTGLLTSPETRSGATSRVKPHLYDSPIIGEEVHPEEEWNGTRV